MTKKPSQDELAGAKATLWRAGKLRYKLHSGQKQMYDEYRAWRANALAERTAGRKLPGLYPRSYLLNCGRRVGKDFLGILLRIEDALRKPGGRYTYATAYQKDITSIVLPLFFQITEDCPLDCKPEYKQSYQGIEAGFHFPNGSVILLIGIERNPDGLRGRFSDGCTISECAFVDQLDYVMLSVLLPMFQGRLDADLLLNTTPPENPGTFYQTDIVPDCQDNGRYQEKTIDDNPLLSESEREEFIAAAGGRDSERAQREYFCKFVRSDDVVVLPEWNDTFVRSSPRPRFAQGFTVIDPGVRDLCAVVTGWVDFERAKVVFRGCWAKRGANTDEVAAAIRTLEGELFKDLQFWNGRGLAANPFRRFSDTEARLILDLSTIHKLNVAAADKDGAEAALNAFRVAIKTDRVEVHPDADQLVKHLAHATWNKHRTSYERSNVYGHFDLLDAGKYAWRMCSPWLKTNPVPPAGHLHIMSGKDPGNILWRPQHWRHLSSVTEKLNTILPGRGKHKKSHTS